MELLQRTHKVSKFEPEDFISNLPDNVVTNILDRLPIQEAVRTSILSRNWRFKWTMLSQLIFDENVFKYLLETKGDCENNYGVITNNLLLRLNGAITMFVLYINQPCYSVSVEDISRWILFLSRKGIKDLIIGKTSRCGMPIKLPMHLFSCLELTHLKLINCCFDPPNNFHGFPNLLSLKLHKVQFDSRKIGDFFSRCRVLEILYMSTPYINCKVKLADIEKIANLRVLTLFLSNLDNTSFSSIIELVGCLPLQRLQLEFTNCKLTEGGAKRSLSSSFPYLKSMKLSKIDLGNGIMLSCAIEMLKRCSDLQTLKISSSERVSVPAPSIRFPEIDYTKNWVLQLRSVEFTSFKALQVEVWLIEYILVCSPFLKKIVIHLHPRLEPCEQVRFARKLLKLQQA